MSEWQPWGQGVQCRELKGGYWGYVTEKDWTVYRGTGVSRRDLAASGPAKDMDAAKKAVGGWEEKR